MLIGANTDALRSASAELDREADALEGSALELTRSLGSLAWIGQVALRFHDVWSGQHTPRMRVTVSFLRGNAEALRRQAEQQDRASSADGTGTGTGAAGLLTGSTRPISDRARDAADDVRGWLDPGGFGVTARDLDLIAERFRELSPEERADVVGMLSDDELARFRDQIGESRLKGGWTDGEKYDFFKRVLPSLDDDQAAALMGEGWAERQEIGTFGASSHGRELGGDLLDHLRYGRSLDDKHIGSMAQDQIEIRRVDGGRYIVELPGVTDLSRAWDERDLRTWEAPGLEDTARDMHYARRSEMGSENGSETGSNAYAFAVKEAMRRAGVPEGADVMFVGHSFGAYTALELAADPSFNSAGGAPEGYHVNVSHVMAAGAAAGFRLGDLPSATRAVLINNVSDLAYLGELAVPTNNAILTTPQHALDGFNGVELGANDGFGHEPSNHATFVRQASAGGPTDSFLEDAHASGYGQAGTAVRVTVKDPYRVSPF